MRQTLVLTNFTSRFDWKKTTTLVEDKQLQGKTIEDPERCTQLPEPGHTKRCCCSADMGGYASRALQPSGSPGRGTAHVLFAARHPPNPKPTSSVEVLSRPWTLQLNLYPLTPEAKHQTTNPEPQISNPKPQALTRKPHTPNLGPGTRHPEPKILAPKPQTPKPQTLTPKPQSPIPQPQTPSPRPQSQTQDPKSSHPNPNPKSQIPNPKHQNLT
jgi:hypothetical protein